MSEPIEYQIVLNLQAALLAMSVATGYYYDVAASAVKLDANVDIEALISNQAMRPFVIIEVLPETREYSPASRVTLKTPVNIHWISEVAEFDDEVRMKTYFRGCADVERAITRDISRGGMAKDHKIIDCTLDRTIDGAQVWAIVKTQIENRRVYGAA